MTKPGKNTLFYVDLNKRRTGEDATKPRALGLLDTVKWAFIKPL